MKLIAGLLASVLAFGIASPSQAAELPDRIKKAGKIVVATMPNYAPITFKDPVTNKLTGFDIDLGEVEFIGALARTQGVELGDRSIPSGLANASAAVVEGVWRMLGLRRMPPLTRFAAAMMSCSVTLRDERARRELGYAPVISVEQGLAELAGA